MGKRIKLTEKYTEVPPDVKVLPSHSFCENCKNSDVRAVKDTAIRMLNLLHLVADVFDINYITVDELEKGLRDFVKKRLREKEAIHESGDTKNSKYSKKGK